MVQISVPENRARALVSRHRERKSSSNKMAAGLNQMVARQSKMAIKNHNTEHRVKTHTYTWQSSSDTPLNTRIQSLRKPPVETQNVRSKISKGGKEARLKEEGGEAGEGAKGVALQTSPATNRHPGVMGRFPRLPEKGGLEFGPTRNQTRPESEFEFSAKRR